MKRLTGAFVAAILISLLSCSNVNRNFYINYTTKAVFSANMPASANATVFSITVPTNSHQIFESNHTNSNLIQSVHLDQVSLSIPLPEAQTFSFLQNVTVYISTDILPEIELASQQNIGANVGNILVLDATTADLQKYIRSNQVHIRIAATVNQSLATDLNMVLYTRFFVQTGVVSIYTL